jgi:hypothetical protein
MGEVEAIEDTGGLDTLRLDGIAPAQLNVYAANGDWLAIDYGAADRVAIINGMGGAIERIVVGGETLSYAQFVGRYSATAQSGVNALGPQRPVGRQRRRHAQCHGRQRHALRRRWQRHPERRRQQQHASSTPGATAPTMSPPAAAATCCAWAPASPPPT